MKTCSSHTMENDMATLKRKAKSEKAEAETKVKEAKPKTKTAADEEFDAEFPFGITDLAEACDNEDPRNIRRWLRSAEVEKAGKRYGWKTQEEVDELAKEFKSRVRKSPGPMKGKKKVEDEPEEPDEVEDFEEADDEDEGEEAEEEVPAPKKKPAKKPAKKKMESLPE